MNFFSRLLARLHGEMPADDLQGFRRAGSSVYDLVAEVDQHRVDQQLAGRTPWTIDEPGQVAALCAWNAFVLQALGDAYLDAHDQDGPVGFAREQTHEQVLAYYHGVREWVQRGREAESTAGEHHISVPLPDRLPGPAGAWRQPYPDLHLAGMRHALSTIGTRAEASARQLLSSVDARDHPAQTATLVQLLAAASAAAEYADQAASARLTDAAQTAAGRQLHDALDLWYQLGQLAAMPRLVAAQGGSGTQLSLR